MADESSDDGPTLAERSGMGTDRRSLRLALKPCREVATMGGLGMSLR